MNLQSSIGRGKSFERLMNQRLRRLGLNDSKISDQNDLVQAQQVNIPPLHQFSANQFPLHFTSNQTLVVSQPYLTSLSAPQTSSAPQQATLFQPPISQVYIVQGTPFSQAVFNNTSPNTGSNKDCRDQEQARPRNDKQEEKNPLALKSSESSEVCNSNPQNDDVQQAMSVNGSVKKGDWDTSTTNGADTKEDRGNLSSSVKAISGQDFAQKVKKIQYMSIDPLEQLLKFYIDAATSPSELSNIRRLLIFQTERAEQKIKALEEGKNAMLLEDDEAKREVKIGEDSTKEKYHPAKKRKAEAELIDTNTRVKSQKQEHETGPQDMALDPNRALNNDRPNFETQASGHLKPRPAVQDVRATSSSTGHAEPNRSIQGNHGTAQKLPPDSSREMPQKSLPKHKLGENEMPSSSDQKKGLVPRRNSDPGMFDRIEDGESPLSSVLHSENKPSDGTKDNDEPSQKIIKTNGNLNREHKLAKHHSEQNEEQHDHQIFPEKRYKIGTKVSKMFFDDKLSKMRLFKGKVQSYDANNLYYKVVYEDGDVEEYEETDITDMLHKKNKATLKRESFVPLLTGTLSCPENNGEGSYRIEGVWSMKGSPPSSFQLVRSLSSDEDLHHLPMSGIYDGCFVCNYEDESGETKTGEVVNEGSVWLSFSECKGRKSLSVKGQGWNRFGIFMLKGVATKNWDGSTYTVRLRKEYLL